MKIVVPEISSNSFIKRSNIAWQPGRTRRKPVNGSAEQNQIFQVALHGRKAANEYDAFFLPTKIRFVPHKKIIVCPDSNHLCRTFFRETSGPLFLCFHKSDPRAFFTSTAKCFKACNFSDTFPTFPAHPHTPPHPPARPALPDPTRLGPPTGAQPRRPPPAPPPRLPRPIPARLATTSTAPLRRRTPYTRLHTTFLAL